MKLEFYYPSANKRNQIHAVVWKPEVPIKAILQVSHGMTEYINRYEEFAGFFNKKGILVVGNDHMGHGQSVSREEEWGYFAPRYASKLAVKDLYRLTCIIKKRFPNYPYFLLGHSMGSFFARRYLMTYADQEKNRLSGSILVGTGNQSKLKLSVASAMVKIMGNFYKDTHRSNFINICTFGFYNKRIKYPKSKYDWLSTNAENVNTYEKDKACTFVFTLNGFQTLFDTIRFVKDKNNIAKISKLLPILLVSGEEDPVGGYGKAVKEIYHIYKRYGIHNIDYQLYPKDRHEILMETDRMDVYQDIWNWIVRVLEG